MKNGDLLHSLGTIALRLSIVSTLLIGVAILVGQQQPPSAWVTFLHLNDCELPCWIGIEPEKTTLDEAVYQIQSTYGDTSRYRVERINNSQFEVIDNQNNIGLTATLLDFRTQTRRGIIENIDLMPSKLGQTDDMSFPTLGDLWYELGNPQAIQRSTSAGGVEILILSYPQFTVSTFDINGCHKLSPNQKLVGISLGDISNDPLYPYDFSLPLPWIGFQRCYDFEY